MKKFLEYKKYFNSDEYLDIDKPISNNTSYQTTVSLLQKSISFISIIGFFICLFYWGNKFDSFLESIFVIGYCYFILLFAIGSAYAFIVEKYTKYKKQKYYFNKYNISLKDSKTNIGKNIELYISTLSKYVNNEFLSTLSGCTTKEKLKQVFKLNNTHIQNSLNEILRISIKHKFPIDDNQTKLVTQNLVYINQLVQDQILEYENIEKKSKEKELISRAKELAKLREKQNKEWKQKLIEKERIWQNEYKNAKINTSSEQQSFNIVQNRNSPITEKTNKAIGKFINWEKVNKLKNEIGESGEYFAFEYEKVKVNSYNLGKGIAPIHSSKIHGDGLGYDIQSFDSIGNIIYIEVKSSIQKKQNSIILTANEMRIMKNQIQRYFIYHLTELNINEKTYNLNIYSAEEVYSKAVIKPNEYKIQVSNLKTTTNK